MYNSKLKYAEKLSFVPDKMYLSMIYFMKKKKLLHWRHPVTIDEKLQWLKVYDRNPLYTKLVDKYEVKKYVANIIGEDHVIPTLKIWDKAEDITWDELPDKFVLKCTHDSHSIVICDKNKGINKEEIQGFLNGCLKRNLFWLAREWPYKDVKPRIIAEEYLEAKEEKELVDYKFFCYGGEPRYFSYSVGEASHNFKNHKFNMKLESIDYLFKKEPSIELETITLPENIDEMINIVKTLCVGKEHVRVDLYNVDGKIYFGEFTFYPGAGFINMVSTEYSEYLAKLIKLDRIKGHK